jgi:putative flippase GtrA
MSHDVLPAQGAYRRTLAVPGPDTPPAAGSGRKGGLRSILRARFVRFLLVAGLNTAFGYALFAGLILLKIPYPIAAAVGTVLGILFNFQTTGRIVFGRSEPSRLVRFFAVYGISYVVGVLLLRWADHHGISILAAAAVLALPMGLFSYTLQRLLVFGGASSERVSSDGE